VTRAWKLYDTVYWGTVDGVFAGKLDYLDASKQRAYVLGVHCVVPLSPEALTGELFRFFYVWLDVSEMRATIGGAAEAAHKVLERRLRTLQRWLPSNRVDEVPSAGFYAATAEFKDRDSN
jgi:hypothetical protein